MYELFFGLSRRPFAAAPDADCYFPATAIEAARQTLFRCIDRGEGAALLIGPAGAGKSLLLQVLAEQFRARFELALLSSGRLSALRELLQAILYELGLPYRDLEEGELRLALIDHLSATRRLDASAANEREGLLLLIDEAHTLPLKLLEEVRLITNLIRGGQPKVRLVLAGSTALEERFTSPKLDTFNQRVSARCYLQAFDRGETHEFIKAQIEWAAGQADRLFTWEALDAVYQVTHGVPRLINQICDHALLLACTAGDTSLGKEAIEQAWADLQQLPAPSNRDLADAAKQGAGAGDVIEFGLLDDDPNTWTDAAPDAAVDVGTKDAGDEPSSAEGPIEIDVFEPARFDSSADELDIELGSAADERSGAPFQQTLMGARPGDFGSPDPMRHLAQVERQIAAINSDYEPEAALGPQVDLSFGSAFDPFGEKFAEEELVIDPFAMTATDALANRPLVQCAEGRKLAALLKPLPDHPAPRLSLAAPAEVGDFGECDEHTSWQTSPYAYEPTAGEEPALEEEMLSPAVTFWPQCEADGAYENEREIHYAPFGRVADSALASQRPDGAYDDEMCEPELIVLEDEPPSVHQVTVVRRGQYRRLFSDLRRG